MNEFENFTNALIDYSTENSTYGFGRLTQNQFCTLVLIGIGIIVVCNIINTFSNLNHHQNETNSNNSNPDPVIRSQEIETPENTNTTNNTDNTETRNTSHKHDQDYTSFDI